MKRTNQIARQAMLLAHSIKSNFPSFSAALKAAWAQIKQPAKSIVDRLTEIGGKRWTKSEKLDRIYFDVDALLALRGISYSCYKTGAISSTNYSSNSGLKRLMNDIYCSGKNYYDIVTGEFVGKYADWIQENI